LRPEDAEVLAAGGVVLRDGEHGPEVAVVHRPRYDDWSLPKGKLDRGENFEQAALREVAEETGMRCTLGRSLGDTTYRDRKDRSKLVRYFQMRCEGGEFEPNDEVDELRWLPFDEAREAVSYDFDRDLLDRVKRDESPAG
jgi:8-oxo-dGTP diphosphatase